MNKIIKKRILILQPYSDQGKAIAKFLRRYSDEYEIIGGLEKSEKENKLISLYDHFEYIDIDKLLKCGNYTNIIPTGAKSTSELMSIVKNIKIGEIIFKDENIKFFNKIDILKTIEEVGIPIPQTYTTCKEISDFPIFFKQRYEIGGGKRGIIYNKADFKKISNDESIFFQEYIQSPITYGFGFLSIEGKLITYFIHKEIYSWPKPGGSGVIVQRFYDDKLIKYSKIILRYFQYSGWGLIEYKYCPKRDDYVFMELNAKFWASIEFAFTNNPCFFLKLFGIHYEVKKQLNCLIFLDRLANYGIIKFVILLIRHFRCKKINCLYAAYILVKNAIKSLNGLNKKFKNHKN